MKSPKATSFTDPSQFLQRTQKELEQHEAANSLLLGLSLRAIHDKDFAAKRKYFVIESGDRWSIAASLDPNRPLVLCAVRQATSSDMALLVEHLYLAGESITSVVGAVALASMFAEEWLKRTGCKFKISVRQRIHKLTKVRITTNTPGILRAATVLDTELVARWFTGFDADAMNEHDAKLSRERAIERVNAGVVYLWDDGIPRAMALRVRPTTNTVSVGGVYTPPEWRSNGFATATVARLSQLLLDEGFSMCVLYTDLANPISNSIYRRIGYEPVADSVQIYFTEQD